MYHSENTKTKLITMKKQRRDHWANPTNTASQSYRKPLVEPRGGWYMGRGGGEAEDIALSPNPLVTAL